MFAWGLPAFGFLPLFAFQRAFWVLMEFAVPWGLVGFLWAFERLFVWGLVVFSWAFQRFSLGFSLAFSFGLSGVFLGFEFSFGFS